jgi:hypothetical protein
LAPKGLVLAFMVTISLSSDMRVPKRETEVRNVAMQNIWVVKCGGDSVNGETKVILTDKEKMKTRRDYDLRLTE